MRIQQLSILLVIILGFSVSVNDAKASPALHSAFTPKLSGIKTLDLNLVPQVTTEDNVNKVFGHFLFALKTKDTAFLNWIDRKGPIPIQAFGIFLNKVYEYGDSERKTIIDILNSLDFKKQSGMKALYDFITEDVENEFSVSLPQDAKSRLSGLRQINFLVLLDNVSKETVRAHVNMILLAMTKSINAYFDLMDIRQDFSDKELLLLLSEFRKFSKDTQAKIKEGILTMKPDMAHSVKSLYDLM